MTKEELKKLREHMIESRNKNFAVTISKHNALLVDKNEFLLSTTHNGTHWISVGLLPNEIKKVYKVLGEIIKEHNL